MQFCPENLEIEEEAPRVMIAGLFCHGLGLVSKMRTRRFSHFAPKNDSIAQRVIIVENKQLTRERMDDLG